mgnify:CR=1 FL=1
MTQPDIDMVDRLVELIDDEWDTGPESVPRNNLRIETSDELGKGRDIGTYDYIEASTTSPIGIEYADLFMNHQNVDVVVFVELKASTKARRNALFDEFRRIVEANRKRPDTPGGYDRMLFQDITPLDDDTFGAYVHEVVVGFEARSRGVGT